MKYGEMDSGQVSIKYLVRNAKVYVISASCLEIVYWFRMITYRTLLHEGPVKMDKPILSKYLDI